MKKIAFLTTALMGVCLAAAATESTNPGDEIGFNFRTSGYLAGKARLNNNNVRFGGAGVSHGEFSASLGFKLSEDTECSVGLAYEGYFLTIDSNTPLPTKLQGLCLDLSLSQRINDNWSFSVNAAPGYRSAGSLSFSSSHAFGLRTYAFATYSFSSTFRLSAGVEYDSLMGSSEPFMIADWQLNEQWTASIGIPRTALTYNATQHTSVSLLAECSESAFNVQVDPLPDAAGKPSLARTNLQYVELRCGLGVSHAFSKNLTFEASAGYVFIRDFDYHKRKFELKSDTGAVYGTISVNASF